MTTVQTSTAPVRVEAKNLRADFETTKCAALAAAAILRSCAAFVNEISDEAYTKVTHAFPDSTVGKHLRHNIDHFNKLARGIDNPAEPVAYDQRDRGVLVETDRAAAAEMMESIAARFERVTAEEAAATMRVRVMLTDGGDEVDVPTTLLRELAFTAHHAVHHHGMIGAIVREQGITPPQGFGRAPATIVHDRG